jgi:peptidyl-tRNA hydrolase, PTH1 family
MRLIVGLGNPGPEYEWTPHNMGFLAVDALAGRAGIRVTRPEGKSYAGHGELAGHDVVLAKPQTMMNLSGMAVEALFGKTGCEAQDLIVLSDEVALPWGMIRVSEGGSAGGHNGLKSVISVAGPDFVRVRMGVRPEFVPGDLAAYVLSKMSKDKVEIGEQMANDAAEAVEIIVTESVDKAMAKFNRRVPAETEEAGEK